MSRPFVKSRDTKTPVANSRAALEKMLVRYGCSSFAFQSDFDSGRLLVSFKVPDSHEKGAAIIPVRLEINVHVVAAALFGPLTGNQVWSDEGIARAERVAWRHLVLWVDAALSASSAGVQRISEAFLAHTLVQGEDGKVRRMVDHMDLAAGGNWKALLPSRTGA